MNPNMITIGVQVNGKTYGSLQVPHDFKVDNNILQYADIQPNSPMWLALEGKMLVKVIKGPNLVNLIVEPILKNCWR